MNFLKNNKNKLQKKKEIENFLFAFLTCLVFLIIIFSVVTFWKGYHNVDLGFNMEKLEGDFNISLIDEGSDGKLRTGSELYILGLSQIESSFISIIIILFIYCFALWIYNSGGGK